MIRRLKTFTNLNVPNKIISLYRTKYYYKYRQETFTLPRDLLSLGGSSFERNGINGSFLHTFCIE